MSEPNTFFFASNNAGLYPPRSSTAQSWIELRIRWRWPLCCCQWATRLPLDAGWTSSVLNDWIDSLYSSLGGGYSNYQQTSGLNNVSQLASSLSGKNCEDLVCLLDGWFDLQSRSIWISLLARIYPCVYLSSLMHLQAHSTKMMMHDWVNQHLLESLLSRRVVFNRRLRLLAVAVSWVVGSAVLVRRWVPMGHRMWARNVQVEAYLGIMGSPVRTPVVMSALEGDRLIVESKSRGTKTTTTTNSDIRNSIELYMFHWWSVFRIEVAFSFVNVEEETDNYHVRMSIPLCSIFFALSLSLSHRPWFSTSDL